MTHIRYHTLFVKKIGDFDTFVYKMKMFFFIIIATSYDELQVSFHGGLKGRIRGGYLPPPPGPAPLVTWQNTLFFTFSMQVFLVFFRKIVGILEKVCQRPCLHSQTAVDM
jgi:hypothetical protein